MRRLIALGVACLIAGLACASGARATALPAPPPLGVAVPLTGVDSLTAFACGPAGVPPGGPTTCLALGQDDDGNWSVVPITNDVPGTAVPVPEAPAGDELTLTALACASTTLCEAVGSLSDSDGDSLAAVVSISGGQPGVPQIVTDPDGTEGAYDALSAVGCPGAGVCEAVGEGLDAQSVEIDGGTPGPLAHDEDPEIEQLDGIVCATGSCEALGAGSDGTGIAVPLSGGTLDGAQSVAGTATLIAAGCAPLTGTCEVLGSDERGRSLVVPDQGGGFGTPVRLSGELSGIACPTATTCAALGTDERGGGILIPFDATAVGPQATFPLDPVGAPVCASATSCEAVGTDPEDDDPVLLPFGRAVTEVALNVGAAHVHGTTVRLPITCLEACAGHVRETASLTRHGSARTRTVALSTVHFALAAAGPGTVSVRLDPRGRRLLAAHRRLDVELIVGSGSGAAAQVEAIRAATLRSRRGA